MLAWLYMLWHVKIKERIYQLLIKLEKVLKVALGIN